MILPLSLPIAFVGISSKPWAPNPFVGANQGAYILGILALVCGCCLASGRLLNKWLKTIYAVLLVMSFAVPAMAETPEQLRARADRMELAEKRAKHMHWKT